MITNESTIKCPAQVMRAAIRVGPNQLEHRGYVQVTEALEASDGEFIGRVFADARRTGKECLLRFAGTRKVEVWSR